MPNKEKPAAVQGRTLKIGEIDRHITISLFFLACVFLTYRTWAGIDINWDTFAYHLPFAARSAGLCSTDCYQMTPHLEWRYDGFPRLANIIQGWIWRITGTPEAIGFLNLASVAAFIGLAGVLFRLPIAVLGLSLVAVPIIQIHATSSYIDLFVNSMVMMAMTLVIHAALRQGNTTPWKLAAALVFLALAVNSKFQMIPAALGLMGIIGLLLWRWARTTTRRRAVVAVIACGILSVIVYMKPLVNTVTYGNPIYPVAIDIAGHSLPGHEPTVSNVSLAKPWADVPRPLIWLASVFEVKAYAWRPATWTIDQGSIGPDKISFRMGGYFGTYVIANLALLVLALANTRQPMRWMAAGLFACFTLGTMFLPANHELRYYLYWIMLLLLLNSILLYSKDCAISPVRRTILQRVHGWMICVCFVSGLAISGAAPFKPETSLQKFLATSGIDAKVQNEIPDHSTACLSQTMDPFTFLYADIFHPGRQYTLRQGTMTREPKKSCDIFLQ